MRWNFRGHSDSCGVGGRKEWLVRTGGLESYQTRGVCGRVRGVWMAFYLVTRDDIAFRLGVVSWP